MEVQRQDLGWGKNVKGSEFYLGGIDKKMFMPEMKFDWIESDN